MSISHVSIHFHKLGIVPLTCPSCLKGKHYLHSICMFRKPCCCVGNERRSSFLLAFCKGRLDMLHSFVGWIGVYGRAEMWTKKKSRVAGRSSSHYISTFFPTPGSELHFAENPLFRRCYGTVVLCRADAS